MKKLITAEMMLIVLLMSFAGICANGKIPQAINKKPNPALAGIERLYIVIDQQQRIITNKDLPDFINKLSAKFKQVGLTVVAGVDSVDTKRDPNIPELIIYIDTIYLDNNLVIGLMELSFATKTRIEGQNLTVKSQVWRARPVLGAIDRPKLQELIKTAISKETDNFILDCIYSKESIKVTESAKPAASTEKQTPQADSDEKTEFLFVASSGSRIYHKPDCPSAKRITPTNLVRFKTREEAEENGRRPCQKCKP